MEFGYLISNKKAINFIKWYLQNPMSSKDASYAKKALHTLEVTHLPAFKEPLHMIASHQNDFANFKDSDIFASDDPVVSEIKNNHYDKYRKYINKDTDDISVKNYLKFLQQQKLVPTQSTIPMIEAINRHSIQTAKKLLKVLITLTPMAKREWKKIDTNSINSVKSDIMKDKAHLEKAKRVFNHWYTRKLVKKQAKEDITGYNSAMKDNKHDIKQLKEEYQSKVKLFNTLAKLGTKFSYKIYDKFNNECLNNLTNSVQIDGKNYDYEPDELRYQHGCVKITINNFGSKNHNFIYKIINKPNADLFIKAIYVTIAHLPYLNLKHVANGYSFTIDATKDNIFGINKGIYETRDFTFVPERYGKSVSNEDNLNFTDDSCVLDYKNVKDNNL